MGGRNANSNIVTYANFFSPIIMDFAVKYDKWVDKKGENLLNERPRRSLTICESE